ncbi:hypothetical protein [Nocardioides sp. 503]|uniref:hypothetical protein n=1 Tax=Nocardioides sp. 503 TaxID=2508326 RepID=UPI001070320E|nr:hypothetical protein [Nocardioides sp. 503]
MTKVLVLVVVAWMLVGGVAAFQRGDFDDGNCSTIVDTACVVAAGPLNYAEPATLLETCNQPV